MRLLLPLCGVLWTGASLFAQGTPEGTLAVVVFEADPKEPIACRVQLTGPDGKAVRAPDLPFWNNHFVCAGQFSLQLPAGKYQLTVERGMEYLQARETVEVRNGEKVDRSIPMKRWSNLAKEGWWSGELHVHRPPEEMDLHLRAEDLHAAPVITFWNNRSAWKDKPVPAGLLSAAGTDRFYHVMAGEDERQGGALLFANLKSPIQFDGGGRPEYPSPIAYLEEARRQEGAWIDIEKPFWWDVPAWVATGAVDSIGIACNHMLKDGMYPTEAWGRPRDANRLPPPRGNGFYSQEIYYRLLNCGFRLPPSAGSASGVMNNPVGYNRVYVHLGERFSYDEWWKGLKRGECFVTNGPALLVQASGKHPGAIIQGDGKQPLNLELTISAYANDYLESVEVIQNGAVVLKKTFEGRSKRFLGNHILECKESGWFLVRAIARVPETFRFASTAPFYVEIGEKKKSINKEDVRYFIQWIDERIAQIQSGFKEKLSDPKELESVLAPHQKARAVFAALEQ